MKKSKKIFQICLKTNNRDYFKSLKENNSSHDLKLFFNSQLFNRVSHSFLRFISFITIYNVWHENIKTSKSFWQCKRSYKYTMQS